MFDLKDKFDGAVKTVACAAAAAAASVASVFFFLVALFLWIQQQYGTVAASLVLAIVFLVVAIVAMTMLWIVRNRSAERQQRVRQNTPQWWADPMVITTALEAVKKLDSKRLTTIVLGAFVVGTLLSGSTRPQKRTDPQS